MPVALYDARTGKRTSFADSQSAEAALAQGTHAPVSKGDVPVVAPDGTVGTVKGTEVRQMLAAGGQLATEEQHKQATLEAKYGKAGTALGLANQFIAMNAGAARGATAGLSDAAVIEGLKLFAPDKATKAREALRDLKDLHPITSAVSEVGGATAAALAGGYGGAARALPGAGIDAVGAGAEAALARLLPQGGGLGMRMLGAGARLGARGAAEGALYAAGNEISEAELGDHDLTAEKLFAAGAKGGLLGAVGGFLLGSAGEGVKTAGRAVLREAAPALRSAAEEQAWKSLSPLKKYSEQANARAGGTAAVGRTILDEAIGPEATAFRTALEGTPEHLAPKIEAAQQRIGSRLGEIAKGTEATVRAGDVLDEAAKKYADLKKLAGREGVVKSLDDYTTSLARQFGATYERGGVEYINKEARVALQDLIAQRRGLGSLAYQEARARDPNMRVEKLRAIYDALGDAEKVAIEEAGKRVGNPGLRAEYETLQRKYQHLSIALDAAETSTSGMATNRTFSLTDNMSAMGAVASGNFLAAPVVAIGHKFIRERGNATAAVVLDKISQLGAIRRAVGEVDAQIARSAAGILEPSRQRVGVKAGAALSSEEPLDVRYRRAVDKVARMQADPAGFADAVAKQSEYLGQHAPNVTASYTAQAARTAQFLADAIPASAPAPGGVATLGPPRQRVTDAEKAAFVRKVEGSDTGATLKRIEQGRASRDEIEAFKLSSPRLFAELQAKTMALAAARAAEGKPLTWEQEQRLHVTLGVPLNWAQTPEGIASLQAPFAAQPAANANGGGTPSGGRRVAVGKMPNTQFSAPLDRIESGKGR